MRAHDGESWWDDLTFPYAGMHRELPEGGAVTLDVGPLEPGEYVLFCGLGSIRGTLVIEDGTGDTGRVAIESADVTLMSGSLKEVAYAIEVSRATKNAKQSLFGAFVYNSLGVPVAAGVLYPLFGVLLSPLIAGGAMAASSVTVVMNSNRLRLFKARSFSGAPGALKEVAA